MINFVDHVRKIHPLPNRTTAKAVRYAKLNRFKTKLQRFSHANDAGSYSKQSEQVGDYEVEPGAFMGEIVEYKI